ncbi:MAG: septum site-determining protein MinC, partial [Firmicutes bacterium]|nr:septum site-determining protein MinC [Bacillota bacterium]
KELSEDEELELVSIVSKKSGLNISFVNAEDTPKKAVISDPGSAVSDGSMILSDPRIQTVITAKENITTFHKGSLRSGQAIEFNGSVIVIGDVNPGSKIKAAGNIIVLGKLKGVVHAGCNGSKDCFVSALYMNPTQLIIADIITYFPPDPGRVFTPEYAYVDNNEIFVRSLS